MFFKPIVITINETPTIIYPCPGIEKVFNKEDKVCIEKYLQELYDKNNLNKNGKYNIIVLWNDDKDIMVDLWIYDKIESWGSGPLVDVKIFRNAVLDMSTGVSAGNGLVLLGLEEQQRWQSKSLEDYLKGSRPKLPDQINAKKSFYDIKKMVK
ncbi:MAG: hypothetical protein KJ906_03835 [Nanoarchaeota archaeon]|nr:hypothetical protein [Nanoarchaeota archaeon]